MHVLKAAMKGGWSHGLSILSLKTQRTAWWSRWL